VTGLTSDSERRIILKVYISGAKTGFTFTVIPMLALATPVVSTAVGIA
jgi:hypothetical protein